MTIDIGTYGVWRGAWQTDAVFAAEVERLGYATLWIGGSPDGGLTIVDEALEATSALKVATGIVNVWKDPADTVAASFTRIEASHPGRFLLGIGIGHPEATTEYRSPYGVLVSYVDRLGELGVPLDRVVLAALGDKVLRLSADRVGGAHPYLVTPEHTAHARAVLGDGVLLAPEHKVVVTNAPGPTEASRAIGRPRVDKPYLGLVNYLNNLRRLGWTDADLADGGSDALIDALVSQGNPQVVAAALAAHLAAGADHVVIQPLSDDPLAELAALAPALGLTT
ncbi:MAG TPA: TIGR03620 family F420-dependent LLM class oxidoreductase [Ilumatobacter sp.]|nr:TIGR03620 family F420-dependent LLM class oxidoreductase [Ilumatobacter sp.]